MEQDIPPGTTTSLVLPVDECVPIWSLSVMADAPKDQESAVSSAVLPSAVDVEMPGLHLAPRVTEESTSTLRANPEKHERLGEGRSGEKGLESKDDVSVMDEDDKIFEEIARETDLLFQDAHNAGYYINEYTTKVEALGNKLLQGLRKVTEKRRDEQATEECSAASKELTASEKRKKDAAANFYKLVHLVNRLQVKSGSEMAFPILFGHMSFTTHRTWEMNMRYPTYKMWASWERQHGKTVDLLRKKDGKSFRNNLNIFLPTECKGYDEFPSDWLLLALKKEDENEEQQYMFISPKGMPFTRKDAALRHVDTERKAHRYEKTCTATAMNDVNMEEGDPDERPEKEEGDGEVPVAEEASPSLTMASSNYFDDWLHRGFIFSLE
jgi:hypothetical protein